MRIFRRPRPALRQPAHGHVRINPQHFAARGLEFAFVPRLGVVQNVVGERDVLAPAASATLGQTIDGWSMVSEASTSAFSVVPNNVTRLTGPVTLLWRGVITGNHSGDFPFLFGQAYGTGSSSPTAVAAISRGSDGQNGRVIFHTNTGAGSWSTANFDISFSTYYGLPITVVASHSIGDSNVTLVLATPSVVSTTTASLSSGSSATRASSSSDVIAIGTWPAVTSRHINGRTTLAAGWSRAMRVDELVDLANAPWAMFEGPRSFLPMEDGAPPPPPSLVLKLQQYGAFV